MNRPDIPLRVLLLATSDMTTEAGDPIALETNQRGGGAAQAVMALLDGLLAVGIEADLLVVRKVSEHPRVHSVAESTNGYLTHMAKRVGRWIEKRNNLRGRQCDFSYHAGVVLRHPLLAAANVVHAHNLQATEGNLSPALLRRIASTKPVFWTLHDTWGITGHCINPQTCERWTSGCGSCPNLSSAMLLQRDTTAANAAWKRRVLADRRIHLVVPSNWLGGLVERSWVAGRPATVIRNALDTGRLPQLDRHACRLALGVPIDATTILFASNCLTNPLKGWDTLQLAIPMLREIYPRLHLLSFGSRCGAAVDAVPWTHLGRLDDPRLRAVAYATADVLAYPTKADSLSYQVAEALACGLPVAANAVGGVVELIENGVDGCLCMDKSLVSFIKTIQGAIYLSRPVRASELKNMDPSHVAMQHLELYRTTINEYQ